LVAFKFKTIRELIVVAEALEACLREGNRNNMVWVNGRK
jgi:hypothetical protein